MREVRHDGADTIVVATVPQKIADELARFLQLAKPQAADSDQGGDTFLETFLAKPIK